MPSSCATATATATATPITSSWQSAAANPETAFRAAALPHWAKTVVAVSGARGFTLLEVLVALVIVGTALGASLRAVGSLTQNSAGLRNSMMATWSAENRLTQIRLAHEFPPLGQRSFACAQGDLQLLCREEVLPTPNPSFRRVEVSVVEAANTDRRVVKLIQVVPNAP